MVQTYKGAEDKIQFVFAIHFFTKGMFVQPENVFAVDVWFAESKLFVRLADGREIGVPIDWFPKLRDASSEERDNWRLIGKGQGIHWETIDEDLSVAGLLKI